jgi:glucoamylase
MWPEALPVAGGADALEGEALEAWIARQRRHAVAGLLRHVSAVGIVKERPGFGQTIRPVPGSVVASVSLGDYDPEPDYFFHWLRDTAVVLDAIRELAEAGDPSADWTAMVADMVAFAHHLLTLDPASLAGGDWRRRVSPEMAVHARTDDDLRRVPRAEVLGDVRYNPDGTVDIKAWGRPQYDGPALRALATMRWLSSALPLPPALVDAMEQLLAADLAFVARHAADPCQDLWEEVVGRHYYTDVSAWAALSDGATRAAGAGKGALAGDQAVEWRAAADRLAAELAASWDPAAGSYIARRTAVAPGSTLDAANLLAVLHAGRAEGPHSARDGRTAETLARLEALFARLYPLNREGPPGAAIVLGRFEDDVYYGGNPWFITTLAAAEIRFRRAAAEDGATRRRLLAEGDAVLARLARFAPADGTLAEQFDRTTGAPVSAKDLAWSHAAFLSATAARDRAIGRADT